MKLLFRLLSLSLSIYYFLKIKIIKKINKQKDPATITCFSPNSPKFKFLIPLFSSNGYISLSLLLLSRSFVFLQILLSFSFCRILSLGFWAHEMKHFMQPRNAILRETELPPPSNPSPAKPKPSRKQKAAKENAPPSDPNSLLSDSKHSPAAAKLKSPLPPRPPSSNPLKRKLSVETVPENSVLGTSDSGVQVSLLDSFYFY